MEPKTSKRRFVVAAMFAIGCFVFAGSAVLAILAELPDPFKMSLAIPANSEVIPRYQVEPGTFKISKTEAEILEKAQGSPEKLTVTWDKESVEFWFPKEGAAAFYYARRTPDPVWGVKFSIAKAEWVSDGVIVFYPGRNIDYIGTLILISFIAGVIAVALIWPYRW